MDISIKDILLMKEFNRCKLISGESGIDNLVTSINSMEIPDITDWLSEGVLLITTGYSIKDDPNKIEELIVNLSNRKASGLAIKTRFIKKISNSVLKLSNDLKIPIIHIPDDIKFSDLSTPIMKRLVAEDNLESTISMEIYSKFINIGIENLGIKGVSELISNIIGHDVLILDNDFKDYSNNDIDYDNIITYLRNNRNDINYESYINLPESNLPLFIKKIFLKEELIAYIVILDFSPKNYTNNTNTVLSQISNLLSLEILKIKSVNRDIFDLDNKLFKEINENLYTTNEEIESKVFSLGWPKLPYSLIYIYFDNLSNYVKDKNNSEIITLKRNLYNMIETEFAILELDIKIVTLKNDFYIILNSNDININKLELCIENTRNKIFNYIKTNIIFIIGDSIDKFTKITTKISELKDALSIYYLKKDKPTFLYEKDTFIEQFFLKNKNNYYLEQFVRNTIGKIIDEKNKDSLDLYNTLYEYIKSGYNALQASKNLYIHRNTLTYRLNKIEKLLQCDLNSFEDRYKITLAIKVNELHNYH